MQWLNKLERKFGRYAPQDILIYITVTMFIVYLISLLTPQYNVIPYLSLIPSLVLKGEVWRLISFIVIPPDSSPLFIFFALYFFYLIGSSLEAKWGSFRFNAYYIIGIIGTIISAFLSGGATNLFLNLSLFFAFATIYPDYEIMLFFAIPVKIKYLALLDALYFVFIIIMGSFTDKLACIAAILNFLLFFGVDFIKNIKRYISHRKMKMNYKRYMR
jgi:hypothetical protein